MTIGDVAPNDLASRGMVAGAALAVAFRVGGGDDLSAIAQCLCRAADWLMRMGQLRQLESLRPDLDRQGATTPTSGSSYGVRERPQSSSKGNQYFTPLVEDGFLYVGNQYSNTGSST